MEDRYSEIGFVQQILGLNLVPRKNGTYRGNDTSLSDFSGGLVFGSLLASYRLRIRTETLRRNDGLAGGISNEVLFIFLLTNVLNV